MLIRVYFKDGRSAVYTDAVLSLLVTDKAVKLIINDKTGEIIYSSYPHK